MKSMKKRVFSILMAAALLITLAACGGEENAPVTDTDNSLSNDGENTANPATVLDLPEAEAAEIDENAPAGTIKWLGYYDLEQDQPDHAAEFNLNYGGEIESEITASGAGYFERLAVLVTSGDSPDLVRYEWMSFPHGMSKNLYMPLDTYFDINDPLWDGVKGTIERFTYAGKHYYFPQTLKQNFALNYNRTAVEYEGLEDPLDMFLAGTWDWNAFKSLISEWSDIGEEYIGYTGVGAMSFTTTTGVKVIDVTPGGDIINNMQNLEIQRCMEFIESLNKQGLVGAGYMAPEEAFIDGKLLFLGMDPAWTYAAAQEALQKAGVDNELAVIPFPRDPNSEEYYVAYDTYGYLIPAGAKNVKGAVDWITCGRAMNNDPERAAEEKAKAISTAPDYYPRCSECRYTFTEEEANLTNCPECGEPRRERFKATFTEQQYDILEDMKDESKYSLIFDDVFGFGDDFTNLFNGVAEAGTILDGPLFNGNSYTQMREIYYETVEGLLQPYREKMQADLQAG